MDPNTALANLRSALADYQRASDEGSTARELDAAERLAEAADALDTWLSRGGSVPRGWQFAREAS